MATHEIQSPMTGNVVEVSVSVGDQISEGDLIIVIEPMKLENEIYVLENERRKQTFKCKQLNK